MWGWKPIERYLKVDRSIDDIREQLKREGFDEHVSNGEYALLRRSGTPFRIQGPKADSEVTPGDAPATASKPRGLQSVPSRGLSSALELARTVGRAGYCIDHRGGKPAFLEGGKTFYRRAGRRGHLACK